MLDVSIVARLSIYSLSLSSISYTVTPTFQQGLMYTLVPARHAEESSKKHVAPFLYKPKF
jgi:hypothetical protein